MRNLFGPRLLRSARDNPDLELVVRLSETLTDAVGSALRGCRRVALLDRPEYRNVGDSAIWEGQKRVLSELGVDVVYEAGQSTYSADECRAALGDGAILLSGGGNLGDLWPEHQLFRERVLADFPDRSVMILPQSVHFQDPASLERARDAMAGRSNLTVFARDERSRALLARDLDVNALLAPDGALGLGPLTPHEPSRDIAWVVRRDQEALHRWPHGADGWSRHARSRSASPLERVRRGCDHLSRGRVVITDRLHGHLMCILLGIPHVVVDNSYGKISAFVETWTSESALAQLAADPGDAKEIARRLVREAV